MTWSRSRCTPSCTALELGGRRLGLALGGLRRVLALVGDACLKSGGIGTAPAVARLRDVGRDVEPVVEVVLGDGVLADLGHGVAGDGGAARRQGDRGDKKGAKRQEGDGRRDIERFAWAAEV